jgi:hypothetical protein
MNYNPNELILKIDVSDIDLIEIEKRVRANDFIALMASLHDRPIRISLNLHEAAK